MRISCPLPSIGRSTARLGSLAFEPLFEKRRPVEELTLRTKGQQKHHYRPNARLRRPRRTLQSCLVAAYACLFCHGRPCAGRRLDCDCNWKVTAVLEGVGGVVCSVSGGQHVEYLESPAGMDLWTCIRSVVYIRTGYGMLVFSYTSCPDTQEADLAVK